MTNTFESIQVRKHVARVGQRTELMFADSYHFNIAAYRLARLLGLEDMVPVSIERRWNGRVGADLVDRYCVGRVGTPSTAFNAAGRSRVEHAALSDGRLQSADLRHRPQQGKPPVYGGLASVDDRLHARVPALAQPEER